MYAARPNAAELDEIARAIEELRYYRGAAFIEVPPADETADETAEPATEDTRG